MKLLIADDEMQIRSGLSEGIDWEELGIVEVMTAENGIEALEICKEKKPEIVLTDIRMPGLNGLELGKQIVEIYQPVSIVILSGYSEFEYAKDAIRLGAFDYLLKPINVESLINTVRNAASSIEKRRNQSKSLKLAENVKRKQAISSLIHSGKKLEGEEYEWLKENINVDLNHQVMIGLITGDVEEISKQRKMMTYLVNYLTEYIKVFKGSILFEETDCVCFLTEALTYTEGLRKYEIIKNQFENVNSILVNQFGETGTCTVSHMASVSDIPLLFKECEDMLKHRLYLGGGSVLIAYQSTVQEQLLVSIVNPAEIREYIAKFDYNYMQKYINNIFEKMKDMQVTSVDYVKSVCLELKNILINVVSKKGVDVRGILVKNEMLLNEVPDFYTMDKFHKWIDNLFYLILKGMSQLTGEQHSRTVIKAIDYISKNYAENINLETISEYVNKSPNYFSYLFKKETGISFIEYLNNTRVNQAKLLLESTDKMTYEISNLVGYNDYKYFSSIFKKIMGVSPGNYRKRGIN